MKNTWIQEKDKGSTPTLKTCQKIVLHRCVSTALNHIKPLGISSTSIQNGRWKLARGFPAESPRWTLIRNTGQRNSPLPGVLKKGRHFPWEQWLGDIKDVLICWDILDCLKHHSLTDASGLTAWLGEGQSRKCWKNIQDLIDIIKRVQHFFNPLYLCTSYTSTWKMEFHKCS